MTNTGRTTETAMVAAGLRASKPRRWVMGAIAIGLASALAAGTVAYGFGSSPGAPRVAISDGTSNT